MTSIRKGPYESSSAIITKLRKNYRIFATICHETLFPSHPDSCRRTVHTHGNCPGTPYLYLLPGHRPHQDRREVERGRLGSGPPFRGLRGYPRRRLSAGACPGHLDEDALSPASSGKRMSQRHSPNATLSFTATTTSRFSSIPRETAKPTSNSNATPSAR